MKIKFHEYIVGSIRTYKKRVPLLRLFGRLLERCGFKPGRKFTVKELSGGLFLTVEEEKNETGKRKNKE